ncbi:MAG: uracil permease [Clostridiales bacterium]|nr:uracil permease [Clostridiales bacterium]
MKRIIQVEERPALKEAIPLSVQHLFAMFSASVLVPTIFGIDPGIVLLMNGIGTLLYIFLTKGKAPAYLGSSFAFIAPTLLLINNPSMGFSYAQAGYIVSGLLFVVFAFIIQKFGTKWIEVVLPPAAMGPVVALIGLELAGTAASTGGMISADGAPIDPKAAAVFIVTLSVAVFGSVVFRKFFSVIPILISIIAGYALAAILGIVDYTPATSSSFFQMPRFQLPTFDIGAIMIILPATLVVLSEHIGHQLVTSKVVGRDIIKEPGLHRTLMGDGLSTAISGFVGAVPTTTYGENIGVMAVTRVYSVWVIGGAAVISIIIAFIGVVSGAIQTIPGAVMGGVSFLLYGMIAASGIRVMVDAQVDYGKSRNLMLTSVVLVTGLSGIALKLGEVELTGMALAAIVGMLLSLIFYILDKHKLTNDSE